jgi:hypothetical protein
MATTYVYNAFGPYDERNGVGGTALSFSGTEFFFPFQQVTAIPNWTFRLLDHDKSTPQQGDKGETIYQSTIIPGQVLAAELLLKQIPVNNQDKGLLIIAGKTTGKELVLFAGCDADGSTITADVNEKVATPSEVVSAEALAKRYKETVVQDYFQSKRQRMAGGAGQLHPDPRTRLYMEELGVEDLDDVAAHSKAASGGLTPEMLTAIGNMVMKAGEVRAVDLHEAVASVRKADGPQLARGKPKSLGLAENKAAYDAEHAGVK